MVVITWSLVSYCTRKNIKENFALFRLPSVKNKLSKQLTVSVNSHGQVCLKEKLKKVEVGGYCPAGGANRKGAFG